MLKTQNLNIKTNKEKKKLNSKYIFLRAIKAMWQYTKHNIIWLLTWCAKYNLVANNIYVVQSLTWCEKWNILALRNWFA